MENKAAAVLVSRDVGKYGDRRARDVLYERTFAVIRRQCKAGFCCSGYYAAKRYGFTGYCVWFWFFWIIPDEGVSRRIRAADVHRHAGGMEIGCRGDRGTDRAHRANRSQNKPENLDRLLHGFSLCLVVGGDRSCLLPTSATALTRLEPLGWKGKRSGVCLPSAGKFREKIDAKPWKCRGAGSRVRCTTHVRTSGSFCSRARRPVARKVRRRPRDPQPDLACRNSLSCALGNPN